VENYGSANLNSSGYSMIQRSVTFTYPIKFKMKGKYYLYFGKWTHKLLIIIAATHIIMGEIILKCTDSLLSLNKAP